MDDLAYRLDRTIVIHAAPATVFRCFTDSERWAKWWGPGSTIEARPGGRVYIEHPGGVETVGECSRSRRLERIGSLRLCGNSPNPTFAVRGFERG